MRQESKNDEDHFIRFKLRGTYKICVVYFEEDRLVCQ